MTPPQIAPVRHRRRSALLWGVLALTLALTLWTALQPDPAEPTDELSAPRSQRAPVTDSGLVASATALSSATAPAPRTAWAALSPAGRSAWTPPPAPTPAPAAKAMALAPARPVAEASSPPQAPPPPFTLIGRYQDSRGPVALLATPQRTLAVREGELADPQWRVDSVAAQRIELTWLPGALKRSLAYPPGT